MPTFFATFSAVSFLSPVRRTVSTPSSLSLETAVAEVSFISSPKSISPMNLPSSSELLPENKVEKVEQLIKDPDRRLVAFAGDGINDAPVIARADIGIAMGGLGSDIAIEAADVVLMNDDPSSIADAVKISRKTMTIVRENIIFALGVKALVLIFGALGLAGMWLAVFADVGVAVIAILNAHKKQQNKIKNYVKAKPHNLCAVLP